MPLNSNLHVEVQAANQALRLVLKKDGAELREILGSHLDLENATAGVYRVEVFLVGHPFLRADVPGSFRIRFLWAQSVSRFPRAVSPPFAHNWWSAQIPTSNRTPIRYVDINSSHLLRAAFPTANRI